LIPQQDVLKIVVVIQMYMYISRHDRMVVTQLVTITTNIVSLNPAHVEVYLIQHYVIKYVCELWQVGGFLWELQFPPRLHQ
jgi:hypothetical protein